MYGATAVTAEQIKQAAMILIPMACIPAYIAKKKGRSFVLWYLYAYGFFIFALIHSLVLTPKYTDKNSETEQIRYNLPESLIIYNRRINYCYIGCPMDALSYTVITNPNTRRLFVRLNLFAKKSVKAFDITLEMRNSMNKKIADKIFSNISYSENVEFDITEYPYAMYIHFTIDRVYLDGGEEWVKHGEPIEFNIDVLSGYELEKLKGLTNKYAVCLPYEAEDYWVCSCAKANNEDFCVICGISRKELFEKVNKSVVHQLKNDLIRRNNLSKFNLAVSDRKA